MGPLALVVGLLAGVQDGPTVQDLLAAVKEHAYLPRERWAREVEALAAFADEEAFEALREIVAELRDSDHLEVCFGAARRFLGTELEPRVVDWIGKHALDRESSVALLAVQGLVGLGAPAEAQLEAVLMRSREESVRARALGGLLELYEREPNEARLGLLLENTVLGRTCERARLVALLAAFQGPGALRTFDRALTSRTTSPFVKTVVLDRLSSEPFEAWSTSLRTAMRAGHPAVEHRALTFLIERPEIDPRAFRGDVTKLARGSSSSVRRATSILLGRMRAREAGPAEVLDALRHEARSRSATDRQAAASLLAELDAGGAPELLFALLADPDRTVAAEALRATEALRRKDSLPVLIQRLERASGQPLLDLRAVLVELTGVDHGLTPARWRAWWEAEGAAFELPTREEVAARRAEFAQVAEERATKAAFYGLPVVSEHLAFLLDLSGSMSEKVGILAAEPDERASRLGVAMDELLAVLGQLRDGVDVNVVFFSSEVRAWSDRLQTLDGASRKNLIAFIDGQYASGSTNLYAGLEAALRDPRIDTLYLLTDGEPSVGQTIDAESIRQELLRWNSTRHVVVHAVAVGEHSELVRRLTEATGGRYLLAE